MKKVSIAIMLLFAVTGFAQSQESARIIAFDVSECHAESLSKRIRTRIIERKFEDQVFTVKIGIKELCCVAFKPSITYYMGEEDESDSLNLDYFLVGNECECDCYYELMYKIAGFKDAHIAVYFKGKPIELSGEKYQTYPVRHRLLGKDTVNFVDKYGFRQGIWTSDSVELKKYYIFKDEVPIEEVALFDNGNVRRVAKREFGNWNYVIEYFESGRKKLECYNEDKAGLYRQGVE